MSISVEGMSLTKARSAVVMRPGGAFSVVIPNDPEIEARRNEALRLMEAEAQEAADRRIGGEPHRSCTPPASETCAAERREQELSLGRAPMIATMNGERIYLHPMAWDKYLLQLALCFRELAGRVKAMREEMAARPEEYKGRLFDLTLWQAFTLPPEDPMALPEGALAQWIYWTAYGGKCDLLNVLGTLHPASRWHVAQWICHPSYPYIPYGGRKAKQ